MFLAPVGEFSKARGPSAAGLVPRARLEARLDQLRRSARCVWVGAPAGSGKSALLASYLAHHRGPVVWCRLEPGDAEPERLFSNLGLGGQAARPLPPMPGAARAGELEALGPYARLFFACLFDPGSEPGVLVLDDYHAVRDTRAFHLQMRAVLAALPVQVDAFVLSRFGPPPEFARLLSTGELAELDWEQLRLDADETCAMVALRCSQLSLPAAGAHAAFARRLHQRTDGWAAGVAIALGRAGADIGLEQCGDADEMLFSYFAEEIFAPCSFELRSFLLRVAALPSFTLEMAQAISANPFAAGLLTHSLRQHCFIERRERIDGRAVYRLHRLFREFLLAHLRQTCPDGELRLLHQRALGLLDADGDCEGCVDLLIALDDLAASRAFLLEHAASLVDRGKQATLCALLASMPAACVEADGRLLYWRAVSCEGAAARIDFERALALLEWSGDAAMCALAWAGLIERLHVEGRDLAAVGPWLAVLDRLLDRFPSRRVATPVLASVLLALAAAPERGARRDALLGQSLERMVAGEPDDRAMLLARMCVLSVRGGDAAAAALALVELRGLGLGGLLRAATCAESLLAQAMAHWLMGEGARARQLAEQAASLAEPNPRRHEALHLAMASALSDNELVLADHYRGRIDAAHDRIRPLDQGGHRYQLGCLALQHARTADADRLFELAAVGARSIGDWFGLAFALADRACAALALGDAGRAAALCEQAWKLGESAGSDLVRYKCLLLRATMDSTRTRLAEAWGLGRRCEIFNFPGWNPDMMARLASQALALDIEPDFVRRTVLLRALRMPSAASAEWPWPVVLRTLGQFDLVCGGASLNRSGKGSRRSLELLKVIIAFGGKGVAIEHVTAAMWPDAEGDSAKGAFDVAIYRLRKLIGAERVLVVSNGRVSLNAAVCWLDAWAFQDQAERVLALADSKSADGDAIAAAVAGMLDHYRGRFLASEAEHPWLLPMRERLRRMLARAADRAGARLFAEKHAAAAPLRQRAREAERG